MDGGINPDAILDSVEFQLFPSQNRYEASVQISNGKENVASGPLEQLLFHSPEIRELSYKGANTKFKILPPEGVNDVDWFTIATLTRLLHIIGLPDILTIVKEISQLEETKKFQLSLSDKAEVDITTSIESKNELLLAVDLRLTSLKVELASALNQAIGSKCLIKDISDLGNFALHFGAKDLRDSLQKSVELTTEGNDSTYSSEEDQPSVERSRDLSRSERPRRSASPMRRIQIGRSGSRRTAALSIKSLSYFPGREKSSSQRDNSSEEENSQRLPKNNVLRLSVQDKISLFESKQKDRVEDIPKTKIVSNVSVTASKSVFRRWSSGMASTEVSSPNGKTEPDSNISNTETCAKTSENISLVPEADTVEHERDESCEKVAELNDFIKIMERKPVRHQNVTSDNSKNKNPKEQKGGFLDLYKKKRGEKIQGEASGKRLENEAKMVSTGVSGVNRRHNEPQKTQKNLTQLINSKTTKPSVKKSTLKTSPLPATRKSWPSTPSPKPEGVSPARTSTGPTSTTSTPTNRKPNSAASVVRSSTKVENSQPRLKTLKATQPDANKRIKPINEKRQPTLTDNRKMTKTNVQTPKPDTTTVPAKPSFYNKGTKKSSVVPFETKPFLRKGSGIKTKVMAQKTGENKVVTKIDITNQIQEHECKTPENVASLDLEPQVFSLSSTKCDESESNSEGLEISSAAWVVIEENSQDEIIPCKKSPVKLLSPANVTPPTGYSRTRVRHSLSRMFFEDSNETDIGEWGNAEHPSTLIYQKDAPRGLKRLLKFARKAKAESAFSEGEDDAEESKATRSFFSLSAFRGNKTNETKLHR